MVAQFGAVGACLQAIRIGRIEQNIVCKRLPQKADLSKMYHGPVLQEGTEHEENTRNRNLPGLSDLL